MRFVTIRDLRNKSAQIQKELPKEKEMVLTSNGRPIAILTATSPERIEESLSLIRQVRAMEAVDSMQRRSLQKGTERMSLKMINKEIFSARKGNRVK
ncbi:MAG: prevent-host-death protein [Candidatus Omnitrophica bacterium CG11_big_fil_rev_8_21_14_0_20_42_13]|uniref:Antitoxin n=1 Tax=Candidatus Ghiorseimicrobium undicola TaxID=1974746 RepID=A0A2H0LZW3_9BACT|nr:MAG: prevent-host-death protein [Candidatus Omnitrophica bacterium CG11_big_fil_rev_8_21_14_0_20_42_13]